MSRPIARGKFKLLLLVLFSFSLAAAQFGVPKAAKEETELTSNGKQQQEQNLPNEQGIQYLSGEQQLSVQHFY